MLKLCSEIARRTNSARPPSLFACRQIGQSNALRDAKISESQESTKPPVAVKWDKLYQMDEISYLGVVSKLKLYQGIASIFIIPGSYIAEIMNHVPSNTTVGVTMMSITTLSVLSLYSVAVKNTIGIIYVCPKYVKIQFAYLNFWGVRNQYETTIENIAAPNPPNRYGLYQTVKLCDGAKTFKLATRHGLINDFDIYEKLFGQYLGK